jgi:hypothetical protein
MQQRVLLIALSSNGEDAIRCPFCGAPYKKLVPQDVLQLNCDYCGATFRPPPKIGLEIPRCGNHPERYAVGKCNDCGGEFCSECLQTYNFSTRDGSALLYLCPDCLRERESKKADSFILGGGAIAFVGILMSFIFWPIGMLVIAGGVIEIVYGISRKPKGGAVTREPRVKAEEPETAPDSEWQEADKLYDVLFTKYSQHWGISTGAKLLEDEIRAYTWHGDSWPEAVRRIYTRQEKKKT